MMRTSTKKTAGQRTDGTTPLNHWGINMWKMMMVALFGVALAGCTAAGGKLRPAAMETAKGEYASEDEPAPAQPRLSASARDLAEEKEKSGHNEPTIYRGTDRQVKLPAPAKVGTRSAASTSNEKSAGSRRMWRSIIFAPASRRSN